MPRKALPKPELFDAIYARVSSKSQDFASQEADLKRYEAEADLPCVWYSDKFSGRTLDRPGWKSLWDEVERGRVRRVIAWKLDRLGRSALDLLKIVEELDARGVDLKLIRDNVRLEDRKGTGRLFLTMLAGFAEYEREVRAERQAAGIAEAKARGVKFGRPKGTGKWIKVTPEQVGAILRMKAEGGKIVAIARATGLSRPTVYGVLRAES